MRRSHNTSIQSTRLISSLQDAGINPEMFASYLKYTLSKMNELKPITDKEKFEYSLCSKQAELLVLLIAS